MTQLIIKLVIYGFRVSSMGRTVQLTAILKLRNMPQVIMRHKLTHLMLVLQVRVVVWELLHTNLQQLHFQVKEKYLLI